MNAGNLLGRERHRCASGAILCIGVQQHEVQKYILIPGGGSVLSIVDAFGCLRSLRAHRHLMWSAGYGAAWLKSQSADRIDRCDHEGSEKVSRWQSLARRSLRPQPHCVRGCTPPTRSSDSADGLDLKLLQPACPRPRRVALPEPSLMPGRQQFGDDEGDYNCQDHHGNRGRAAE